MKIGELIAIARECKGWTLRDLERECGISNALISQIETGKVKDPGFSVVVKIADALGARINRAAETVMTPRKWRRLLRKKPPSRDGDDG